MDIVAVLTKVVQELRARNEMLEQRVLALEGKKEWKIINHIEILELMALKGPSFALGIRRPEDNFLKFSLTIYAKMCRV